MGGREVVVECVGGGGGGTNAIKCLDSVSVLLTAPPVANSKGLMSVLDLHLSAHPTHPISHSPWCTCRPLLGGHVTTSRLSENVNRRESC